MSRIAACWFLVAFVVTPQPVGAQRARMGGTLEQAWTAENTKFGLSLELEVDRPSFVAKTRRGSREFPEGEITNMCVNAFATIGFLHQTDSPRSRALLAKIKTVKCVFAQRTEDCSAGGRCKMGPYPQPEVTGSTLLYPVWEYSVNVHQTLYYLLWRAYDLGGTCPAGVPHCKRESAVHNRNVVGGFEARQCKQDKEHRRKLRGNMCWKWEQRQGSECVSRICFEYKQLGEKGKWIDHGQDNCAGCRTESDFTPGSHGLHGPYFKWDRTGKAKGPRYGTLKL